MANFLLHHNIPLAVADHLSPLLKDIFPDSKIAEKYAAARTKTTSMINGALAAECQEQLVSLMHSNPFSLSTDGSNDNSLEKMNPLTVRIFDTQKRIVTSQLLDMCLTSGKDAGKAASIYNKVDEVLGLNNIPWRNCLGFSVDNTSTNLEKNN